MNEALHEELRRYHALEEARGVVLEHGGRKALEALDIDLILYADSRSECPRVPCLHSNAPPSPSDPFLPHEFPNTYNHCDRAALLDAIDRGRNIPTCINDLLWETLTIGGERVVRLTTGNIRVDIPGSVYDTLEARYVGDNFAVDFPRMCIRYCSMTRAFTSNHQLRYFSADDHTQLFASPLNVMSDTCAYCSAYPDTDLVFGSLGTWRSPDVDMSQPLRCNPPFIDEIQRELVGEIACRLASGATVDASVILGLPETPAFKYLEANFGDSMKKRLSFRETVQGRTMKLPRLIEPALFLVRSGAGPQRSAGSRGEAVSSVGCCSVFSDSVAERHDASQVTSRSSALTEGTNARNTRSV